MRCGPLEFGDDLWRVSVRREIADEVHQLRIGLTQLGRTLHELRATFASEKAQVNDLPARRAN
jgi:hypothetical protein